MSLGPASPARCGVIAVTSSVPAMTSCKGLAGAHRLVSTHTTGDPANREGSTRSANRVSRSAHCTSSIATSTGVLNAISSSNALIRSTNHSGLS